MKYNITKLIFITLFFIGIFFISAPSAYANKPKYSGYVYMEGTSTGVQGITTTFIDHRLTAVCGGGDLIEYITTNIYGNYFLDGNNYGGGKFGCGCGPISIIVNPPSWGKIIFNGVIQNGSVTIVNRMTAPDNVGAIYYAPTVYIRPNDTTPPTATVSGPSNVCVNSTVAYTASASDSGGHLSNVTLWKTPTNSNSWSSGPFYNSAIGGIGYTSFSTVGSYYVAVNALDSYGNKCTGNPFGAPSGWSSCGAGSFLTTYVVSPPLSVGNVTIQPNPSNQAILNTAWTHDGANTNGYSVVYSTSPTVYAYGGNAYRSASYSVNPIYCDGKTPISATVTAYNGNNPASCQNSSSVSNSTTCCVLPSVRSVNTTYVNSGSPNSARIDLSWEHTGSNINGFNISAYAGGSVNQNILNINYLYSMYLRSYSFYSYNPAVCNGLTPITFSVTSKNTLNGASCQTGSTISSAPTTCCILPSSVTGMLASSVPSSLNYADVNVSWEHTGTNISGFNISGYAGSPANRSILSASLPSASRTYSQRIYDTNLCNGLTPLSYSVTSKNTLNGASCQTGSTISVSNTTTCCILPSSVTGVLASSVPSSLNYADVNVSWEHTGTNISGFNISGYAGSPANRSILSASLPSASRTYSQRIYDTNICNGLTPITFSVTSKNTLNGALCQMGMSSSSPTTCCIGIAPVDVPSGITLTEVGGGNANVTAGGSFYSRKIKLNWNYNNNWGNSCAITRKYFNTTISGATSGFIYSTSTSVVTPTATYQLDLSGITLTNNENYTVTICPGTNIRSGTCATATFIKKIYPTITINGSLSEFVQNRTPACTANVLNNSSMITIRPPNTAGVTQTCTLTPLTNNLLASGYACTITLDNVNNDPNPNQIFTIGIMSSRYSQLICRADATCSMVGSNCGIALNFLTTPTAITQNLSFVLASSGAGFYKLKNTSYYDKGSINLEIPATINKYTNTDVDDTDIGSAGTNSYFNIGDSTSTFDGVGLVSSNGSTSSLGNALASRKRLQLNGYPNFIQMNVVNFLAKRKLIQNPTIITAMDKITDGVFQVSSGFTIDGNALPSSSAGVVIIGGASTGNVVTLSAPNGIFNPNKKPLVIVADRIVINGDVTQIDGILIANTFDLGTSSTPLKINGNIINTGSNEINTLVRSRTDDPSRPSLFIVFDINQYMGVLKYLGTANLNRVANITQ
ncbi:MAG: hypothetical protein WCO06_00725 [Candidatus Roizmanbacteria bacterium]